MSLETFTEQATKYIPDGDFREAVKANARKLYPLFALDSEGVYRLIEVSDESESRKDQ